MRWFPEPSYLLFSVFGFWRERSLYARLPLPQTHRLLPQSRNLSLRVDLEYRVNFHRGTEGKRVYADGGASSHPPSGPKTSANNSLHPLITAGWA